MEVSNFEASWLKELWRPADTDTKFNAGQVTIVGGSSLFHGAPLLSLRAVSRLVGMVYFATPEADRGVVEKIKSELASFIWIPLAEIDDYVAKSEAVLIGPGMMRNRLEAAGMACDEEGKRSKEITLSVLAHNRGKRYVLDGGALQVISATDLPKGALITPNRKEYEMLFREKLVEGEAIKEQLAETAKKYSLVIVHKAPTSIVTDGETVVLVGGGNPGLVKGGVGDVVAGLVVGLLAKNEPVLAAAAAVYLAKRAADELAEKVGFMFNADDLAETVGRVYREEV